jgi:hypothetical protein
VCRQRAKRESGEHNNNKKTPLKEARYAYAYPAGPSSPGQVAPAPQVKAYSTASCSTDVPRKLHTEQPEEQAAASSWQGGSSAYKDQNEQSYYSHQDPTPHTDPQYSPENGHQDFQAPLCWQKSFTAYHPLTGLPESHLAHLQAPNASYSSEGSWHDFQAPFLWQNSSTAYHMPEGVPESHVSSSEGSWHLWSGSDLTGLGSLSLVPLDLAASFSNRGIPSADNDVNRVARQLPPTEAVADVTSEVHSEIDDNDKDIDLQGFIASEVSAFLQESSN